MSLNPLLPSEWGRCSFSDDILDALIGVTRGHTEVPELARCIETLDRTIEQLKDKNRTNAIARMSAVDFICFFEDKDRMEVFSREAEFEINWLTSHRDNLVRVQEGVLGDVDRSKQLLLKWHQFALADYWRNHGPRYLAA